MSCPRLSPDTGGRDIDGSSFIPRHHLLMPVLLYFLLLCKSSKERCPRPLFGAKASAKVRTSTETAKHFRDIFSIFFPENTGIYPLQPEKSTPHGKNSPPRLQNGTLAAQAQWHTLKEITGNLSEIYGDFLAKVLSVVGEAGLTIKSLRV